MKLKPYIEHELRAAEAERHRIEVEAKRKAAAPSPAGFVLTGSERPVDVAAAHGQDELF